MRQTFTCNNRRGVAMLYTIAVMAALVGLCSFGADYARVQLAKTELQRAADAAARYAASAIPNGTAAARGSAITAAADNKADGTDVALLSSDVEFGTWNSSNRTFTVLTGSNEANANAVRVTARRTASRGTAIPLTFARLLGRSTCEASASAIALLTGNQDDTTSVPSTSNPWLAGMPSGTVANPNNPANNSDTAPAASPKQITGVSIAGGMMLSFDSINGGANNFSSSTLYTPDGNPNWIISNWGGAEHGKSDLRCPINAVVGVFLTDSSPAGRTPPATLDFSTEASRDFSTLSPRLRQVFFIGDGRKSDGTVQRFIAPAGATRLYIGTMDGWEWNNNVGGYTTTIHKIGTISTVK